MPVTQPEPADSSFVDNVGEAMKLVEKMEKHLPLMVRPSSALVKSLRKQGVHVGRYEPDYGLLLHFSRRSRMLR